MLDDVPEVLEPRGPSREVVADRLDLLVLQHLGAYLQAPEYVAECDQNEVGLYVKAPECGREFIAAPGTPR